jgi:hypothetical protein
MESMSLLELKQLAKAKRINVTHELLAEAAANERRLKEGAR